jgi:hypothetical protein
VQQPRHRFHEDLAALETRALDGLDIVIQQLDRSLEAISYQDVELLGISETTASKWYRLAGGEWSRYAAQIDRQ